MKVHDDILRDLYFRDQLSLYACLAKPLHILDLPHESEAVDGIGEEILIYRPLLEHLDDFLGEEGEDLLGVVVSDGQERLEERVQHLQLHIRRRIPTEKALDLLNEPLREGGVIVLFSIVHREALQDGLDVFQVQFIQHTRHIS